MLKLVQAEYLSSSLHVRVR
uniref:Uncharacterized protein n=1 Tax=Rhizophora mucronata TaxID=61149 RepID=A0A2P2R212_RHIMU